LFDRYNGPARRALQLAFREARRRQHDFLGTEHLLYGLLCDHGGPSAAALRRLMQTPEDIQHRVEEILHEEETGAALERFPLSPAVQRALQCAADEASQAGQSIIGPEHLLLGLLHEHDSQAALVLNQFGLNLEDLRRAVRAAPASEKQEHLLQATARQPPGGPDPTPQELLLLVAPMVPLEPDTAAAVNGQPATEEAHAPDIAAPGLADAMRHAEAVENQLRKTQLILGASLGFYFGQALNGWQLGVLGALAGACLALLRSSFAGAWMGFMAGCVLLPGFLNDGDDRISLKARFLLGFLGAVLGSFLGDFWRSRQPPANEGSPFSADH
jgi:hypothetical protein